MQLYARHLRRSTPFEIERSIREFEEIMVPLMELRPRVLRDVGARTSSSAPGRCSSGT